MIEAINKKIQAAASEILKNITETTETLSDKTVNRKEGSSNMKEFQTYDRNTVGNYLDRQKGKTNPTECEHPQDYIVIKGLDYSYDKSQIESETVRKVEETAKKTLKEQFLKEDEDLEIDFTELCEEYGCSDIPPMKEMATIMESSSKSSELDDVIKHLLKNTENKYFANLFDLPKDNVVQIDAGENYTKKDVLKTLSDNLPQGVSITNNEHDCGIEAARRDDIAKKASYASTQQIIDSKSFNSFLSVRSSLEKYSANNIGLIYVQYPDAKAVMGAKTWEKHGRKIKGGEKAIDIIMPDIKSYRTEKAIDKLLEKDTEKANSETNPALKEQKLAKIRAKKDHMMKAIEETGSYDIFTGNFRGGFVFDIDQTRYDTEKLDHDNYDDLLYFTKPLDAEMENYDSVVVSMTDAAKHGPLSINDSANSQQDALYNAIYNYAEQTLRTSPEKIAGIRSNIPNIGEIHLAETAVSAYLICKHIGIDCDEQVNRKLAEAFKNKLSEQSITVGRRNMFEQAFDRACKLADEFNKGFDKTFKLEMSKSDISKDAQKINKAKDALVLD